MHVLDGRYDGSLAFENLVGDDEKVCHTLKAAKPVFAFHVLLARLERVALGSFADGYDVDVHSASYSLRDIVQVSGRHADIHPRVSDVDLLDE